MEYKVSPWCPIAETDVQVCRVINARGWSVVCKVTEAQLVRCANDADRMVLLATAIATAKHRLRPRDAE